MKRSIENELVKWKNSDNRKPLILNGARQVGKTYSLCEFGEKYYKNTIYVNLETNLSVAKYFDNDISPERIIRFLEAFAKEAIVPDETLVILDEVQSCERALTSLKYFCEEAPEYHIAAAGSLLGVALHQGTSFPVGKVEFLDLYPLSYFEFLMAMGKKQHVELLQRNDFDMASTFRQDYVDLLKYYYYVGGMPEAVQAFADNRDFSEVREIQQRILDAYEQDFSKHAPYEAVPRIRMLWNSIPAQLAKENKKFIYGLIKEGARAKEYELAMLWLTDCGLVHKVQRVTAPGLPLKAYEDLKAFKLFLADVGLLSCMTGLRQDVLLDGNRLFKEFKGALTEQYVLQQLKTVRELNIYYWTNERGMAEVDFVVDNGCDVIPIEVKAETNLQAKSLKSYREKFQPKLSVRTSMSDYKRHDWLLNLPLWAIGEISSWRQ